MIKCNGCVHLIICSSREEKCQHYQSEADICREFIGKVDERFTKSFQGTIYTYSDCVKLVLAEMENEQ